MHKQDQQRIVRALVQEINTTLQRYYRQSLKEVVQDLTLRNVFGQPPSDRQVLKTLYETGVLRLSAFPKAARLHSVLERFSHGTIGFCSRCGSSIDVQRLEKDVSTHLCRKCQHRASARKVPS